MRWRTRYDGPFAPLAPKRIPPLPPVPPLTPLPPLPPKPTNDGAKEPLATPHLAKPGLAASASVAPAGCWRARTARTDCCLAEPA